MRLGSLQQAVDLLLPLQCSRSLLLQLKGRGVAVHGVLYRDKADAAAAYLKELGDPFAALGDDAKGRVGIDFGVTGVPETFVIDGKGVIVARFQGPLDEETVKTVILPALEKAGS